MELALADILATLDGYIGRPRRVLQAVLRALSANLPGTLAAVGLPQPRGYHWAGEEIRHFPVVSVAQSVTTEEMGAGREDTLRVIVSWDRAHPLSRRDWQLALDTATVIRGLLYAPQLRGPVRQDNGDMLWDYTVPVGLTPLAPDEDRNYGGFSFSMDVIQRPGGFDTRRRTTASPPSVDVPLETTLQVLNSYVGRPRLALDAALAVLAENLPAILTERNLPAVGGYFYAGEEITDATLPAVIVSASSRCVPAGMHFADNIHLVVTYVTPAPFDRRAMARCWEAANCIRAVLQTPPVSGPYREQDGAPHAWHRLISTGLTQLPTVPEGDYGGIAAHFDVLQNPAGSDFNNLWPTT